MSNKIAHLEMIQNVVNRMSVNAFLLKGWSVLVVSAFVALSKEHVPFAYVPMVLFWALDGYFLQQERSFRDLYDEVRALRDSDIDFSMRRLPRDSVGDCMFRPTVVAFHAALMVAVGLLVCFR